jgi:hypothetical protein
MSIIHRELKWAARQHAFERAQGEGGSPKGSPRLFLKLNIRITLVR